MTCRYRYVFADGSERTGEQVGSPAIIEAAGYLAGALGVTVLVVA
ncbi:hypothetical protein ACIPLR_12380 [Herbaspirillum huttiense]|nr:MULTISPECIES: hypothetical protein [Herbaspirillum]MDT0355653.1 hypothetical protein [Herbaspirillum huttiense F1]BEV15103.1 hypothetical protein HBDW_18910 [Herbaspirillum sp. DW155]